MQHARWIPGPAIVCAALAVYAGVTHAAAPAEAPPAGVPVIGETAYWRGYVQFGLDRLSPEWLTRDGERLLGAGGMKEVERKAARFTDSPAATAGRAAAAAAWRDRAYVWFSAGQGDSERAAMFSVSPPPPPEWPGPEFDATRWSRQRLPFMLGNFVRPSNMHGDKEMQELRVRRACFRTSFVVTDPAAGDYALTLTYRGGVRVLLNGTEVARGHLAAGADADAGAGAEPYAGEAYLCLEDEVTKQDWERQMRDFGKVFCEDLPGTFEDCAGPIREATPEEKKQLWWNSRGNSGFAGYFGGFTTINARGFQRITSLRNRALGPVTLPRNLLHQGENVLAVEVRAADIHPIVMFMKPGARYGGGDWGAGFQRVMYWAHCRLLGARLVASNPGAPSSLRRPPGVQVWAEDMHTRCFDPDFSERPGASGTVRFVGANNGVFGAQVVVGTDRPLAGLKVSASDLAGPGGARLPAAAVSVAYFVPHPADQLVKLGQIRNMVEDRADPLCPPAEMAVLRYGPPSALHSRLPREARLAAVRGLRYFDHLGPAAPAPVSVPADACQPVWLSLRVPADAAPGKYAGTVRVEADGMPPASLPVEAEIFGCSLPEPLLFQTHAGCEQSPYGVARQYGVPLWSDAHFRLLEASFRQLARVGNDMVLLPVLQNMEFGNYEDAMVRWIRRRDGSLAFDYSVADRYLDLAVRHLGVPRVIGFCVMHGADRYGPGDQVKATVSVRDEATGQTVVEDLGCNAPGARERWQAFATQLYAHLRQKGLERSLMWGFVWDAAAEPQLFDLLAEFLPDVAWIRGSHGQGPDARFRCVSNSIGPTLTEVSQCGWKQNYIYLLCPRSGNAVLSSNGHSPPFTYRLMAGRAIVAGLGGIGRLGADYWADIYFQGYKGSLSGGIAGMPCSNLLYPGPDGAESSARYEAMIEGIQEAEARIFLERTIGRGLLPADLARRAGEVLFRNNQETLFISPGRIGVQIHEYATGWQERTRRLFAVAAEAAEAVPFGFDRTNLAVRVAARSSAPLPLVMRNWSVRPRAWKAAADAAWLDLPRREGSLLGHETLAVRVDAAKMTPGAAHEGRVTVTDVQTGLTFPVAVRADVGLVFDLLLPQGHTWLTEPGHASSWHSGPAGRFATFNVAAGGAETREFTLANLSGTGVAWRLESPVPWAKAQPASGTLGAGLRIPVALTVTPPGAEAATSELALALREVGGGAAQDGKLVVHTIPVYSAPALPTGAATDLKEIPKERVKSHRSSAYWFGTSDRARADFGPRFGSFEQSGSVPPTTLSGDVAQDTIYNLEGLGCKAFSARVEVDKRHAKPSLGGEHLARVNFEIHVDGRVRAQSGLMRPSDAPRLLVVEGLEGAKELRLFVRFDRPEAASMKRVTMHWHEPKLYLTRSSVPGTL